MSKKWIKPELTKVGDLNSFVQTGNNKTGPNFEGQGQGGGEEPMR